MTVTAGVDRGRHHAPLNAGCRFSAKAARPSRPSSLRNSSSTSSRSRARPPLEAVVDPLVDGELDVADRLRRTRRELLRVLERLLAAARRRGTARRRCRAHAPRSGVSVRPVIIRSRARLLPIRRGSRCVPPLPGSSPRVASGVPSRYSPSAGEAEVAGERDLEPPAERVAVDLRDEDLRDPRDRRERPVRRLDHRHVPLVRACSRNALMSAPAQKNFSDALRRINHLDVVVARRPLHCDRRAPARTRGRTSSQAACRA